METSLEQLANFQPKQIEAIKTLFNSECKYLLFGGAAGGGKSYFLRWCAVFLGAYYANRYGIKRVPIGLFSEDYPTLKDRQIRRIKMEFPRELGELKEFTEDGFAFLARDESFIILLRNLDDPSKYASTEFAAECVEELTKNPIETFEDLRFRLRYPGVPDPKFVAATNPGQIGHVWVKKLWIEPVPGDPDQEQDKFFFVPSLVSDNKYIDEGYIEQLKSLPEQKQKAYLEGSWDVFAGQVLTEWNRNVHVIKPFAIPKEWRRYISIDWGTNAPSAVGWFANDPIGRSYLYRELYVNSNTFEKRFGKPLTAHRMARIILAITKKAGEKYEYCVADKSMFNKILLGKENADGVIEGQSYAEFMMNAGLNMIQSDSDRVNGLGRVRQALSTAPDGLPYFQVFENCYDTIRTLPAMVYDKVKVEEIDDKSEDHAFDMVRYFFMSRPAPTDIEPRPEKTIIETDYQRRVKKLRESDDLNEADEEFIQ